MDGLPGFLLAALALAGSPGPATLSLAAAGAAFGPRASAGYLGGIVAGMAAVMALAAAGMTAALLALPGARPAAAIGAAGYFLYLAWRIATAPPLGEGQAATRRPSFLGGILLSLLNPKGYAAMAALFSGFTLGDPPALDAALKAAALLAIMLAVNVAWLLAGAALARRLRDPAAGRALNLAFALLLLASAGLALWMEFSPNSRRG